MTFVDHTVDKQTGESSYAVDDKFSIVLLFTFLSFVVVSTLITLNNDGAAGQGNILRQAVYFGIFSVVLVRSGTITSPSVAFKLPISIQLTVLWFALSLIWSVNAEVAARRLLLTLIVTWTVFLLVRKCGYSSTTLVVRLVLPILLVINYIVVIIWPEWGIHQRDTEIDPSIIGAWRGILIQKNFAGALCALTVIYFSLDASKVPLRFRIPTLIAAAVFLVRTESKTSMLAGASGLIIGFFYTKYSPRFKTPLYAAILAIIFGGAALVYSYIDNITAFFLRPDSLTGRTQIWPLLVQYSSDHLMLGSGYGSFWNIGENEPIYSFSRGWVAGISSGHNGYLDLLVQVGLPGILLAILSAIVIPIIKLLSADGFDRQRGSLLLASIWFCAWHNLGESSFFDRDASVNVFMMLTIALLHLDLHKG